MPLSTMTFNELSQEYINYLINIHRNKNSTFKLVLIEKGVAITILTAYIKSL